MVLRESRCLLAWVDARRSAGERGAELRGHGGVLNGLEHPAVGVVGPVEAGDVGDHAEPGGRTVNSPCDAPTPLSRSLGSAYWLSYQLACALDVDRRAGACQATGSRCPRGPGSRAASRSRCRRRCTNGCRGGRRGWSRRPCRRRGRTSARSPARGPGSYGRGSTAHRPGIRPGPLPARRGRECCGIDGLAAAANAGVAVFSVEVSAGSVHAVAAGQERGRQHRRSGQCQGSHLHISG